MATKTYEEVVKEDAPEVFLRLQEASGTNAADATRFGRDFTFSGSPTLDQTGPIQDGQTSKAISLDGSDDVAAYSLTMPLTGYPVTLEQWMKTPASPGLNESFCGVEVGDTSVSDHFLNMQLLHDSSDDMNVRIDINDGTSSQQSDFRIPNSLTNEWVHVVAEFVSATERNVYANGVLIGTSTTSVNFPSGLNAIRVGDIARDTTFFWPGFVAEPALYNYQLGADRARVHHAVGRGFTGTDSYGYAVMTSGPMAWLRLQETSGTSAADASGNKRDFTHAGSPTLDQAGPLDAAASGSTKAVSYDGTDDRTTHTDHVPLTAYPVSFGYWAKVPGTTSSSTPYCLIEVADNSASDQWFQAYIYADGSNNLEARIGINTGATNEVNGFSVPNTLKGQWVYIVAQFVSATERNLYINGALIGTATASVTFPTGIDSIAIMDLARNSFGDNFYEGFIAEPGFYNYELSASDLRNHYAKGKQYLETDHRTKTLAKCPSIYWRQGESSGTDAADETEFGRDGTYAGTGPTLGETGALTGDTDTAVQYNGTDDQLTYSETFITQYPVTVEALVKLPSSIGASNSYIRVGLTDASGTMKMVAGLKTDSNTKLQAFLEEVGTSTGTINNACGGAVGNYHHLVAEFISDTSRKIWLNGVELEEETTSVSLSLANLDTICVGVEDLGTDAWYAGYCDEFVLYQRQLSTAEKRDQYLSGLGYHSSATLAGSDAGFIQLLLSHAPGLCWPLNETSGTDAVDATRWGRDGTYSGGFSLDQNGPISELKSINVDGTDGKVEYSDANDQPATAFPMTMVFWAKSPASLANSTDYVIFSVGDTATTNDDMLLQLHTDGSGNIYVRGETHQGGGADKEINQNSGTGIAAQNNKFLHCALVLRSSTDRELYVQGRSAGTDTNASSFPSNMDAVRVGQYTDSGGAFYEGFAAGALIFPYELTESQLREQFIAGRGVFEAENPYLYEMGQLAPAVHYRLNESSGAPADLLGLRDLTKEGAPTQSDSGGPIANVTDDGSIQFDGTDDAIAGAFANNLGITGYPFAVIMWGKTPVSPPNSTRMAQTYFGDDGTDNNRATPTIESDGSGNITPRAYFRTGGTNDNLTPTSPVIEAAVYHHLIFVARSATDRELYCNGASVATGATSRTFPSGMDSVVLGRNLAASPTFKPGVNAEVSVLDASISDSEALDLYIAAFEGRGLIPLGEVSVTGRIDSLVEMQAPTGLSFASLGYNSGAWGVRVSMHGSITKDFRNVQTFSGAMGIVAELDGVVSAQFTREREGRIDIVAEFNSPVTFEKMKTGQLDAIAELVATKTEGDTPVTDQDIGEAVIFRVPRIDYTFRALKHPTGRKL